MKRLAGLAAALTLSVLLSGCGSASYSYYQGYRAGQDLAANLPHNPLVATRAAATTACRVDWPIAGSIGVGRTPWLRGCIKGYEAVTNVVDKP
jgi:hypothetical protein